MHTYMHDQARRQSSLSFHRCHPGFIETGSLTGLQALGIHLPTVPLGAGNYPSPHLAFFNVHSKDRTHVFMFAWQALYLLNCLPVPVNAIFKKLHLKAGRW